MAKITFEFILRSILRAPGMIRSKNCNSKQSTDSAQSGGSCRPSHKRTRKNTTEGVSNVRESSTEDNMARESSDEMTMARETSKEEIMTRESFKEDRMVCESSEEEMLARKSTKEESMAHEMSEEESIAHESPEEDNMARESFEEESMARESTEEETLFGGWSESSLDVTKMDDPGPSKGCQSKHISKRSSRQTTQADGTSSPQSGLTRQDNDAALMSETSSTALNREHFFFEFEKSPPFSNSSRESSPQSIRRSESRSASNSGEEGSLQSNHSSEYQSSDEISPYKFLITGRRDDKLPQSKQRRRGKKRSPFSNITTKLYYEQTGRRFNRAENFEIVLTSLDALFKEEDLFSTYSYKINCEIHKEIRELVHTDSNVFGALEDLVREGPIREYDELGIKNTWQNSLSSGFQSIFYLYIRHISKCIRDTETKTRMDRLANEIHRVEFETELYPSSPSGSLSSSSSS